MATKKKRINITLEPELEKFVTAVAKRDKIPVATKIASLLEDAMDLEEDKYFSRIGDEIVKNSDGKYIPWKDVREINLKKKK